MDKRLLVMADFDRIYLDPVRPELEAAGIEVVVGDTARVGEADLIDQAQGCAAVLAGSEGWTRPVLEQLAGTVRFLVRCGTGYDAVDVAAATECGVQVANTPGQNLNAVAEMAFAFLMALQRRVKDYDLLTRGGGWRPLPARELSGKTVGLVGFGGIARRLARLLSGFECELLAYDVFKDEAAAKALGARYVPLEELLEKADTISLHLPLLEETRGLINRQAFERMKDGAILINTSRGPVVEESALLWALESGKLAGAGLDVYHTEPADVTSPLFAFDNVLFSPHMASATFEATSNMVAACVRQTLQFFAGQPVDHPVNSPAKVAP